MFIVFNVCGLCCLWVGVFELLLTIKVYSIFGRFFEYSWIYCFENGGIFEFFIGLFDLMTCNFFWWMEAVVLICDLYIKAELENILCIYEEDNCLVWDM